MSVFTKKRKRNNIVPPFKLCKLIPAGEFKKTVFVWEVTVWETLDEKGNVIEHGKILAVIDRDATGKRHKVPKTAKQKLKLLQDFQPDNNTIYYTAAVYPAPTLQEFFQELILHNFSLKHNKDTSLWEGSYTNSVFVILDKNPLICLVKMWLKQMGIEA